MWTSGNHARNWKPLKPLYVCPACQRHLRRQLATFAHRRINITTDATIGNVKGGRCRAPYGERSLSSSGRLRSQAQTLQSPTNSDTTPKNSIAGIVGSTSKQKPSENSVIRGHLRAWSVQNHRNKAADAQSQYNTSGRLSTLPQSLFIEETPYDEREPEVELDYDEEDTQGGFGLPIEPGDLFYFHSPLVKGRPQFAVYLGMVGFQSQILLSDGRWTMELKLNILPCPVLPNFASAQEIESIRKHLPVKPLEKTSDGIDMTTARSFTDDVPHSAAAELLQRIEEIRNEVSEFRRDNLQILDTIYERIAHEDNYVYMPLDDIFQRLFGLGKDQLPYAAQVSVFLALRQRSDTIQPVSFIRGALAFTFLPRKLVSGNEKVCSWARQYQESAAEAALGKNVSAALERNPLTAFIDKARRLILKSRALRSPTTTGSLGPSSIQSIIDNKITTKETGIDFSEQDKVILEFLWDCYVRMPFPMVKNRNHSIGSLILRAIGAYPKLRLERKIGSLLLQEMGVLPPWADSPHQHIGYQFPGAKGASELDSICAESDRICDELGVTKEPQHGLLEDSMAFLRQDLGDMPAFCVDDESTQIRDDAFSFEPNDDKSGTYWIHVHIAHPSAFVGPDHIFSKRARRLSSTFYIPTYASMLPDAFAHAMSLRAGSPALTISTLLTETGEVEDIKLRPTTIHNVIQLAPAAVSTVLGQQLEEEMAYLAVGKRPDMGVGHERPVSETQLEAARRHQVSLQKLHELLLARSRARRKEIPEPATFEIERFSTTVYTDYVGENDPSRIFQSYHYLGDPAIEVACPRYPATMPISNREEIDSLTANTMILANESAGKWFAARGIPACFQGARTQPGYPLSVLNKLGMNDVKRYPVNETSSRPIPHVYLDATAYLRFTSPIRRFTDLLAHWQADAYLRAEAQGAIMPGERADEIDLPFTTTMLDKDIINDDVRNRRGVLELVTYNRRIWLLRALFRAFHFKEAQLPDTWDLHIRTRDGNSLRDGDTGITGRLLPFDAQARVLASAEGWEKVSTRGSYLPVKLELVDLAQAVVFCKAVGSPSDKPNITDPIRIIGYSGTQGDTASR